MTITLNPIQSRMRPIKSERFHLIESRLKQWLSLAVMICASSPLAGMPLPKISTLHPRIFLRNDQARIGIGLKLKEFQTRFIQKEMVRWRQPVRLEGIASAVEIAARYLEEGKKDDLFAVRDFLATHTYSYQKDDVGGFLAGAEMAVAYDWIYQGLSPEERVSILANIEKTANSSRDFLLNGEPDINHNYTYMALDTVAVCGLVLHGEPSPYHQKSIEYLQMAEEWLESPGKVLDTWKARGGAWSEGTHYTFHETWRNLVMTFQAYRTASDRDYFALQGRKFDNFMAKSGQFLAASTRPDWTMERIGDCSPSRALPLITVPVTMLALINGMADSQEKIQLQAYVRELVSTYGEAAVHPVFGWGMRIFTNPLQRPSSFTPPLFQRFGPGTDDRFVWRNGWNKDSTQITILAGDHYTDHQHFDKGHFLIYNRGALAVDGGSYDSLYEPQGHWNNYACRTLAHNCLLLYDPDEPVPAGYNRDGGQIILRGLQHHGDWLTYLTHAKREDLDTATVIAYDPNEKAGYAYLHCDLTGAYPRKAAHYGRQFLYLPHQNFLFVYDRVIPLLPRPQAFWLLHFQDPPAFEGFSGAAGIADLSKNDLLMIKRQGVLQQATHKVTYDGSMIIHTLLPENAGRKVVGGAGFEYFNRFDGKNYPPKDPRNTSPLREAGAWRLEVEGTLGDQEIRFLHALELNPAEKSETARIRLVNDEARKMTGAFWETAQEGHVVFFSGSTHAQPVQLPLTYKLDSWHPVRHLLTQLLGLSLVEVAVNGKRLTTARISPQGVLEFKDNVKGERVVVIKPVKEDLLKLENQLPAHLPRH
jgi:hypothetical protein